MMASISVARGGLIGLPKPRRHALAQRRSSSSSSARRAAALASVGPSPSGNPLFSLADAAAETATQAAAALTVNAPTEVVEATSKAAAAVDNVPAYLKDPRGGWLGPLVGGLEDFLRALEGGFEKIGIPYAYGWAIIALTIAVKALTFPLTKTQVESSLSMQRLQPQIKAIQARNADDKEAAQQEVARLYRDANVNPLAGCLPTLATIPVFISLYRALGAAAVEGYLDDSGFYFIPSLGGPTTMGGGLGWLFPLEDGHPPIGSWDVAGRYLILPVMLLISQYASQAIMTPPNQQVDESQKQTMAILKFLPIMIAWFSLNVPSGLGLYWFTNNIVTTGIQVYLKQGGGAVAAVPEPPTDAVAAGTARRSSSEDRDLRENARVQEQEARRAAFSSRKASEEALREAAARKAEVEAAAKQELLAERSRQAAAAQKAKEAMDASSSATATVAVTAGEQVVAAEFSEVVEEDADAVEEVVKATASVAAAAAPDAEDTSAAPKRRARRSKRSKR